MAEQTQSSNQPLLTEFPVPSYDEWQHLVEQQLKGVPFEKKVVTKTYEGINLQPLYRQEDVDGLPHLTAAPGFPPYVRGADAGGNLSRPWAICQEIPYGSAEEFNAAIRHDLERGQSAVNLTLDTAARMGQDPDAAQAGDVGANGVSVATVADLEAALDGIDLKQVPLTLNSGNATETAAALLFALLKKQGQSPETLRGSLDADPLGNLVEAGTLPGSVSSGYDALARLFAWAKNNAPQMGVVTVHEQPYNNAGASAAEGLAFVLASAVEYLRQMQARGLPVDEVAPRLRFSLSLGANYFMEVAKLRAARIVWAKVVKAFGGSAGAQKLTIHAQTAAYNKTRHDPWVNMLRTTVEAFAGAVGGANSMHTGPFNEVAGPPDEFSRRIARNTQIILQNEAHLNRVIDPAGGSWYVEKLTDELARSAWSLFQQVEKQGGMLTALQAGFPQQQVAETAAQRAKNVATRKDIFVGANKYPNLLEKAADANLPDFTEFHQSRTQQLAEYRSALNEEERAAALDKLANILETAPEAAMNAAIDAALAGATLGDLTRAFNANGGETTRVKALAAHRGAEPFEALRHFSDAYLEKTGTRPQVFLANLGPIPKHKARADFSTDFFRVGGFEVIGNNGFDTPQAAAQAALDSGAPVVVICGTDDIYPEVVPPLVQAVKSAKPEAAVILAGYPKNQIDAHKAAGVDEFIHVRADVVGVISALQQKL